MNHTTWTTILMMTAVTSAWAQGRGGPCTLGTELSYGISAIDCLQCTVRADGTDHWTEYGAEPVVRAVMRTANPVQPGDVLVAIDGKPITTAAGGRALSHPEAGHAARFMIRRSGRSIEVNVMPGTPCPIVSAATAAALTTNARTDTLSTAAKDSVRKQIADVLARMRDTLELRYERDAFGRPYHFTFANGDSVNFNIPGPGRMAFESNGRLLFITDSVGYQRFLDANGGRVPPRPFQWERIGFTNQMGRPDTLLNGAIRTISNDGRDTTFTVNASRKGRLAWEFGQNADTTARLNTADMSLNTTRGWLGFALDCLRCTADRVDPSSKIPPVHFTTPPRVVAVEPGAAAAAGFKVGDVIRTIDGKQMASPAGATRFSSMQGGERVQFGIERGRQLITLTLVVPKPY